MFRYSWGIFALGLFGCTVGDPSPIADETGPPLPNGGEPSFPGTGGKGNFVAQPPIPGPVLTAHQSPPPISGGTLLVLRDQKTAVVADPDRDQVLVVDLENLTVKRSVVLDPRAEPGRAADDADGHVHLLLRGSGKLLTFDPTTGDTLGTRDVCKYPRGLAVSDGDKVVHVACAEGSLVTLSTTATDTTPVRTVTLDSDLRDVVIGASGLWVSRFRSAEILRLDTAGKLLSRVTLPPSTTERGDSVAEVAWRMTASVDGGVVVVHQRAFTGEVVPSPGGYGASGQPGGIVETAVSVVDEDGVAMSTTVVLRAPLPVDVAQSAASGRLLLASAAIEHPLQPSFGSRTLLLRPSELTLDKAPKSDATLRVLPLDATQGLPSGQLVAVAFAGDTPVMQYREPSVLVFGDQVLSLPGHSVEDTGTMLFHLETSSGLACASCHPEGQEDGHVWHFSGFGPRRTQSLRGGLLGSEPFHWDGAESDFQALSTDVMQGRMGGPELSDEQNTALANYVDNFPALPAANVASSAQIDRGKTLFNDTTVACASCHSGAKLTSNLTVDVGSVDGVLQVPSLIGLWARAPYLHNGCAKTIGERFNTACDTGKHGNVKGLSSEDLGALTAYLETL
jgi:mono/diheme cytochrome c family protein